MTAAFAPLRARGAPARATRCWLARSSGAMRRCSWWAPSSPCSSRIPRWAASCWNARFWGCRPAAFWPLGAVRRLGREPIARSVPEVFLGSALGRGGVLRLRGRPGGGRRARPEAFAARQRGRPAPASGGSPRVRPRAGRRRRHAPFGQDRRRHRRCSAWRRASWRPMAPIPAWPPRPRSPSRCSCSSSSASPPCSCSAAEAGRPPRTSRLQRGKARSTGPTGWRCCS